MKTELEERIADDQVVDSVKRQTHEFSTTVMVLDIMSRTGLKSEVIARIKANSLNDFIKLSKQLDEFILHLGGNVLKEESK